jgi:hypothetical protein
MRGYPDQGLCRHLADQFKSIGWDQGVPFSGRFEPSLFARPRPFRNCSRVHLWQEKQQIEQFGSDYQRA